MKVDYAAIQHDPALQRGLYGLTEITRYLSFDHERQLAAHTVARWVHAGLTVSEHKSRRADYSFADLVTMLVVRNLVELGLSLGAIRDTEAFLRERYDLEHPFLSVRLKTDGADVFYEASPSVADQLTAANRGGQEVLRPAITSALKGVEYIDALAAKWTPVAGILLDPTIQFGEPCVVDSRVTTSQLAEMAAQENAGPEELAKIYRLNQADVRTALEFERRLALAS
jgi:uncharacterized protein (DUF433 family)